LIFFIINVLPTRLGGGVTKQQVQGVRKQSAVEIKEYQKKKVTGEAGENCIMKRVIIYGQI
jgi:hypothetical protein